MSNNQILKRNIEINANYILYLFDIFEGKISIGELKSMPLAFLTEIQTVKEKQLKEQKAAADKALKEKEKEQMTVSNTGQRYNAERNKFTSRNRGSISNVRR